MRFLGRRVYVGAIVVLVAAMMQGPTRWRTDELRRLVGADRRTLERWRRWWTSIFPATPFWRVARGRLPAQPEASRLPASLLESFAGAASDACAALLRFVSPLSTSTA